MPALLSYEEVLERMYARLPMFSRIGGAAYKPSLENTLHLCGAINHPQAGLRCIHVAGTNGKGSVSHWLASIFQAAGYKTGLYTSPHLKDFRERIRVDGAMIPKEEVVYWYNRLMPAAEDCQASFFEMTVAMMLGHFKKNAVDIAIIETGMGGRLDSTNVVNPLMSVITYIGMDHQQFLGDTLALIATEKAGIIKGNTPVLIGRHQEETASIFKSVAFQRSAPLLYAADLIESVRLQMSGKVEVQELNGEAWSFTNPLQGSYQRENMATVVAAIHWLNQTAALPILISREALKAGLEQVVERTGIKGRWQVLKAIPKVVADVGHNEDGISAVMQQLKHERYQQLHIIFGAVKDKDVAKMLSLMPTDACYYFCEPPLERKLPAEELASIAETVGISRFNVISHPSTAYQTALYQCSDDDLLLILGSFFVVGEIV
jgi:dihydrofolate synthase / folylpolyglutamate synthase